MFNKIQLFSDERAACIESDPFVLRVDTGQ